MARRRYLIAYDISDAKRLRRVIKIMEGHGERLQYSVFLCDLSGAERAEWEGEMRTVLNFAQDSVVCIDLGPQAAAARIVAMGIPRRLPIAGSTVI